MFDLQFDNLNICLREILITDLDGKTEKIGLIKNSSKYESSFGRVDLSVTDKNGGYEFFASLNSTAKIVELSLCFETDKTDWVKRLLQKDFECGVSLIKDQGSSNDFFALFDDKENALAFLPKIPFKFVNRVDYKIENGKTQVSFVTEFPHSYDDNYATERVFVKYSNNLSPFNDVLSDYKENRQDLIKGWSSWDYYFTSVSEADVKENVDCIKADECLSKHIKYIAIDDGWQQREGDWRAGSRFPSGLKATVDYINKNGFVAGVWTAPIRLHNLCGTVMRRNAFLVRNDIGDPISVEGMYILDPTHPDGEKFIIETFTYLKESGFKFYKVDFISDLLTGKNFYDKNAGPYDAVRKLITIIRGVVGDDCHVMGCAYPYGGGAGYVNSSRTGYDIHNHYCHIILAGQCVLPRTFAQFKVYRNDIDYLIVRGKDTSFEDDTNVLNPAKNYYRLNPSDGFSWRKGADFSFNEAKTWCALQLATASSLVLGDRISALNENGLKLLEKTFAYADGIPAIPKDFISLPLPSVWFSKENERLYLFNWSDNEFTFENLSEFSGKFVDIFTQKKFIIDEKYDNSSIKLQGRDALVLKKQKN